MSQISFGRSSSSDADCDAYNAVFHELGFDWSWDQADYAALLPITDEKERIAAWLKSHHAHLLKAYDPGFLVDLIYSAKQRHCQASRGPSSRNHPAGHRAAA
jgi:hypothetical protein